jgi:WD40 repeat protein
MRFLAVLLLAVMVLRGQPAVAQTFYDQAVLVVDPGTHTGRIRSVAVDDTGSFAVTGSFDKTIRIWSLASGDLVHTLRMPSGPGDVGQVYAVAISQQNDVVAAGGWTSAEDEPETIYLFDPQTLHIRARIPELPDVVTKLAFSIDGRYLAAAVGTQGLRIYDKEKQWREVFRDENYRLCEDGPVLSCVGKPIYGLSFATDGRLATASYDQKVRLYGPGPEFKLVVPPKELQAKPHELAFKPDGKVLAVGSTMPAVDFLDGHDLHALPGPTTDGLNQKLAIVTWSRDGNKLFVGGGSQVYVWDNAGLGQRRVLPGGEDTVLSTAATPDGGLLVAAGGPLLKYMEGDGHERWRKATLVSELGSKHGVLSASRDGSIVDFGLPGHLFRFDVKKLTLTLDLQADGLTAPPKRDGLPIIHVGSDLIFAGRKINLEEAEACCLAISLDSQHFVFGTTRGLHARDANNRRMWRREAPSSSTRPEPFPLPNAGVWAVNITGDNRYVLAAYDDGTIRWHRLETGREVLGLMVLKNDHNKNDYDWVAWTPEGYFASTAGALGVLRWHANNEQDERAFASALPAASIPGLRRPDILPLALETTDPIVAAGLAQTGVLRSAVQVSTGTTKPPGATLHVLAIGINYSNWSSLTLHYADKDARDLAETLVDTQGKGNGLYAGVIPHYLDNTNATRDSIAQQLNKMALEMKPDDVAVVMFSGHGAIVNGRFYLLPSDVNILTGIQGRAISASDFQGMVEQLAYKGRVLVLLDACRAGAFADQPARMPNAEMLKEQMSSSSAPVLTLTSSSGKELSHEDAAWEHGAFTKVLLDALSQSTDAHAARMMTAGELTEYLAVHLHQVTGGKQTLGLSNHNLTGALFVTGP